MIFGNYTVWMSDDHPHQTIRLATSFPLLYGKRIQDRRWLNGASTPSLDDYLLSAHSYMRELSRVYVSSFDESYRRQSELLVLDISGSLQIGGRAKLMSSNSNIIAQALPPYLNLIEIELGTLLAIEDACQTLMSHASTPLGLNSNENGDIGSPIITSPDNALFDKYRYVDYEAICKSIPHEDFCKYLFKTLSKSEYRQKTAEFLSTISLLWILSHEDAHSYHGHILYINQKLGISADNQNILFSELIAGILEKNNPEIRKSCEIEADNSACARLVDHIIDADLLDLLPILRLHEKKLSNLLAEYDYRPKQVLFVLLLRFCITAQLLAISVFERNVIKRNANTSFYPNFIERTFNIITTSIFRAYTSIENNPRYGLEVVSPKQLAQLVSLVMLDMKAIARNVLRGDYIIHDAEMLKSENIQVLRIIEDPEFTRQMIYTIPWLQFNQDKYNVNLTKYGPFFLSIMESRIKYMKLCVEHFFDSRLLANPSRQGKVYESAELEKIALQNLTAKIRM
jgi:hypothetical protein